jgi:hypothetical protein
LNGRVREHATQLGRRAREQRLVDVAEPTERLGRRHLRHVELMLEARFGHLKRRGHVKDLLAMLDRDDAPAREAAAVAAAIDVIDDGRLGIPGAQEIAVQRVHGTVFDGLDRGDERLSEHLAAEHALAADVAAQAPEHVLLEPFEAQQREEIRDHGVLGGSQRT